MPNPKVSSLQKFNAEIVSTFGSWVRSTQDSIALGGHALKKIPLLTGVLLGASKITGQVARLTEGLATQINPEVKKKESFITSNIQPWVIYLSRLGVAKVCKDYKEYILTYIQQTQYKDYFSLDRSINITENDPKVVASIKRVLHGLDVIRSIFEAIETLDLRPEADLSQETIEAVQKILAQIGDLDLVIRNLNRALLDVKDILKPIISPLYEIYQNIPQAKTTALQKLRDIKDLNQIAISNLYSGGFNGIECIGRTIALSPYLLDELTEALKYGDMEIDFDPQDLKIKKIEEKYAKQLQELSKTGADQNSLQKVKYYQDLSITLASLLGELNGICKRITPLSEVLYHRAQEINQIICYEILPQFQSHLEENEEHFGLRPGTLVTPFIQNASKTLETYNREIIKYKKVRLVMDMLVGLLPNISQFLQKIQWSILGFKPTEQSIFSIGNDQYQEKMKEHRKKRYDANEKRLQDLEEAYQNLDIFFDLLGNISSEKMIASLQDTEKQKLKLAYKKFQPYFASHFPKLDIEICKALNARNSPQIKLTVKQINLLENRRVLAADIRELVNQEKFHQEEMKTKYPGIEHGIVIPPRADAQEEKPLKTMAEDFYQQDLFAQIKSLKLSAKADELIAKTNVQLEKMLAPEIYQSLGIQLPLTKNLVISHQDSEILKPYKKLINSLVQFKIFFEKLEKMDDIEDNASYLEWMTYLGASFLIGQDEKKIKRIYGFLYPLFAHGVYAFYDVQSLLQEPLIQGAINDMLDLFEPIEELKFIVNILKPSPTKILSPQETIEAWESAQAAIKRRIEGAVEPTQELTPTTSEPSTPIPSEPDTSQNLRETQVDLSIMSVLRNLSTKYLSLKKRQESIEGKPQTTKTPDTVLDEFIDVINNKLKQIREKASLPSISIQDILSPSQSSKSIPLSELISNTFVMLASFKELFEELSVEHQSEILCKIKDLHHIIQFELATVVDNLEIKMGLKSGAYEAQFHFSEQISVAFENLITQLTQINQNIQLGSQQTDLTLVTHELSNDFLDFYMDTTVYDWRFKQLNQQFEQESKIPDVESIRNQQQIMQYLDGLEQGNRLEGVTALEPQQRKLIFLETYYHLKPYLQEVNPLKYAYEITYLQNISEPIDFVNAIAEMVQCRPQIKEIFARKQKDARGGVQRLHEKIIDIQTQQYEKMASLLLERTVRYPLHLAISPYLKEYSGFMEKIFYEKIIDSLKKNSDLISGLSQAIQDKNRTRVSELLNTEFTNAIFSLLKEYEVFNSLQELVSQKDKLLQTEVSAAQYLGQARREIQIKNPPLLKLTMKPNTIYILGDQYLIKNSQGQRFNGLLVNLGFQTVDINNLEMKKRITQKIIEKHPQFSSNPLIAKLKQEHSKVQPDLKEELQKTFEKKSPEEDSNRIETQKDLIAQNHTLVTERQKNLEELLQLSKIYDVLNEMEAYVKISYGEDTEKLNAIQSLKTILTSDPPYEKRLLNVSNAKDSFEILAQSSDTFLMRCIQKILKILFPYKSSEERLFESIQELTGRNDEFSYFQSKKP